MKGASQIIRWRGRSIVQDRAPQHHPNDHDQVSLFLIQISTDNWMSYCQHHAGTIDPSRLITHRFPLDRIIDAYDIFGRAAETKALKAIISA